MVNFYCGGCGLCDDHIFLFSFLCTTHGFVYITLHCRLFAAYSARMDSDKPRVVVLGGGEWDVAVIEIAAGFVG